MPFLREALRDIERNWRWVTIYTVVVTVAVLLVNSGNYIFLNNVFGDAPENARKLYEFVAELFLVCAYAAMQAIVFAEIGKDIDKPLYKVEGPGDALRRFFTLWLLLNLAFLAIVQGSLFAAQNESAITQLLVFFVLAAFLFIIPFGACIMFTGRLHWPEVIPSLAPLGRQIGLTLIVLLIAFFQFYIFFLFGIDTVPKDDGSLAWAAATIPYNALSCILDCLLFACVWRICIIDRDTQHDDDLDF